MFFRAVGRRCAVHIPALGLPADDYAVLRILMDVLKCSIVLVHPAHIATDLCGRSQYRLGALPSQAPTIVNCSTFTKWLYGECGIWLPQKCIQQRAYGVPVKPTELQPGDLVFTLGCSNYFSDNSEDAVGHVGMYVGNDSIIHAAGKEWGVVSTRLPSFLARGFRGAQRYMPYGTIVLDVPNTLFVETSDDLKWLAIKYC